MLFRSIRTMLSYGFAAKKIWWQTEFDRRITRQYTKLREKGRDQFRVTLKEEEKVVFNGPKSRLIDPFDFLIDVDAIDVRDARYIGDFCEMTLDEINAMGDAGVFKNYKQLEGQNPLSRSDYISWYKEERDHAWADHHNNEQIRGGPKTFYVVEVWGRFDLFGTGRTRECVVTLANFNVPIRIQENPFDDKHRPYAIARANRDAFDFHSIGPFDNAIRPQLSMNTNRFLANRSHKLSLAPWLAVPDTDDLPETLWEVEPGSILPMPNPGAIKEISVKSSFGEMRYADQIFQQDIEEITGSTRMLGGTENSDTATEATQKLSESSRRLRAYIQSYTMMLNDQLEQMHALNAQYVTTPMKFRVLGKRAKGLKAYEEIDPEVLQTRVDFTFTALGSLHSGDLRATQLMQYLNLAMPIMAQHPGSIDTLKILQMLWTDIVGRVPADEVVNIPTRPEDLLTQREENMLLAQGQEVEIDRLDDDEEHLEEMTETFGPGLSWLLRSDENPKTKEVAIMHYQKHLSQMERKRAAAKAAMRSDNGAVQPPQQEFDTNRGTHGTMRQPGDVNGYQQKQGALGGGVGQSPMGETPGTPFAGNLPAADRNNALFQSQGGLAQ